MKKTVLTFGVISGVIISLFMLGTLPFHEQIGFDRGLVVGYTGMLVAFLLVYFGVRSYRDNVAGGTVKFGRAFVVGALIALISSAMYTATWEAIYFGGFMPDFAEKYQAHVIESARAAGASQQELDKKAAEQKQMWEMYQNPIINIGMTLIEPLPVGLVIALISAAVLSRKRPNGAMAAVA
ncbi:MAG: DUF4199 domain-containing protein [Gemmatimonadaceae bacterium]